MFALIRTYNDFPRACHDISKFLAFQRQRSALSDALVGIWCSRQMLLEMPTSLLLQDEGHRHTVNIHETFGISGLWTLCCLSLPNLSHRELLEALLHHTKQQFGSIDTGGFTPVYQQGGFEDQEKTEIDTLSDRYPHIIRPPIQQDPRTRHLVLPAS